MALMWPKLKARKLDEEAEMQTDHTSMKPPNNLDEEAEMQNNHAKKYRPSCARSGRTKKNIS